MGRPTGPRLPREERRTSPTARVAAAVRTATAPGTRFVVAVSGGRDSMVLLEAIARVARSCVATIATFDHGTGPAATAAASLVRDRAGGLGLPVRVGVSGAAAVSEAEWRAQRLTFLIEIASELGARVMTAHTLDDHLETVVMRVLRGAGARGLAGLLAPSNTAHPFVGLTRSTVAACARRWSVPFVDDPTNLSRRYLRNRVRMDLLPALSHARPTLPRELLALSRRAADLRLAVDHHVDAYLPIEMRDDALVIARSELADYDAPALELLWPAVAARHGVTLDRRGTERLVSFTIRGAPGARIQLSGGVEAVRHRDRLLLRRVPSRIDATRVVPLMHGARWGEWRFAHVSSPARDRWSANLSAADSLRIRGWRPGDRMIPEGSATPRRLKGLFRDAGIDAERRRSWPVVVAGEEVVWVPGVRRASAAPARSGRPTLTFRCERLDR